MQQRAYIDWIEPQIDEDEEARAEAEALAAHEKARAAEWDIWESMKEACY